MKHNKIISLVTIFLLGGIGNSFAGPIEVNITGSVTGITGLDTPPSGVSVGDTVTGTFTYNTDTAPTDSEASAEIGRYKFTNNETFSLTIGSLIWLTTGSLADDLELIMLDNFNNTLDNYSWVAQGNANDEFVSFPDFGGAFYEMVFALTDNVTPFDLLVNDLLPDDPTDIQLSSIETTSGHIRSFSSVGSSASSWTINFDVQDYSMAVVPEPSTMLLLASSLIGLGFIRRRRIAV